MTRNELEKYLGENVQIKLFDDTIISGVLRKSGDDIFKSDPNLYIPRKFYFLTKDKTSLVCETCLFRVSHIKQFKHLS